MWGTFGYQIQSDMCREFEKAAKYDVQCSNLKTFRPETYFL